MSIGYQFIVDRPSFKRWNNPKIENHFLETNSTLTKCSKYLPMTKSFPTHSINSNPSQENQLCQFRPQKTSRCLSRKEPKSKILSWANNPALTKINNIKGQDIQWFQKILSWSRAWKDIINLFMVSSLASLVFKRSSIWWSFNSSWDMLKVWQSVRWCLCPACLSIRSCRSFCLDSSIWRGIIRVNQKE